MKKRTLVIGGAGVALIAAAIAGPIIYAKTQDDAPAPLSITESPSTADTGDALETSGTWKVASGSKAGYRVDEVLNGQDVTVVGRTGEVTGAVTIAADKVTAAKVTIETASIETDSANRDNYFRSESLKVDRYPTATFTLDAPVNLPGIGNKPVKVKGKGELTLAGQSEDVNVAFKVVRSGDGVAVSGAIPITFEDFGIPAPNLGFVKVEDSGTVEFLLNLEK
ncbi:MAG: YceI family protein [Actinomycetota bacterium]|nr:YceI family protein [Actinomycetota bacterium]